MIAVLAIDGSDASLDALMPSFEAATRSQDTRLDVLEELRRFRLGDPRVVAMLERASTSRASRLGASPALDFAASIGLPRTPGFSFTLRLHAPSPKPGSPPIQLILGVDGRDVNWYGVTVFGPGDRSTTFGATAPTIDELGLGTARPEDWPRWLTHIEKKLRVTWPRDVFIRSSFRGAKRAHIVKWLMP